MHLAELGLLLHAIQHVGILLEGLERILDGVLDAEEGLIVRQVIFGVLVPIHELNGICDAHSSFLVAVFFEFGYTCLEVILGELPAETAQSIIARSVDLYIHRLHLSSPRIVFLLPQNVLNQLIFCNISAQLNHLAKPSGRLTFVVVEGLVDALTEHFEEEREFLYLLVVPLFIVICEVDFLEMFNLVLVHHCFVFIYRADSIDGCFSDILSGSFFIVDVCGYRR